MTVARWKRALKALAAALRGFFGPCFLAPCPDFSRVLEPSPAEREARAEVFTRFEEGDTPVDVVREMRLPPDRVRVLHREWTDLRAMGGGSGPSIADRLAELESRLKELTETLSFEVIGVEVNANTAIGRLESRL